MLGQRSWRLFVFEIKKIGEITKVNGFNDAFRNGATSATECQAAKRSDALITIISLFFLPHRDEACRFLVFVGKPLYLI